MIDDRHDGFQPLSRVLERVMDRLHEQLERRSSAERIAAGLTEAVEIATLASSVALIIQ